MAAETKLNAVIFINTLIYYMKIETKQQQKEQNALTIVLGIIAAICIVVTLLLK